MTTSICCLLGCASGIASAAEWSAQTEFAVGADVDTNRRLIEDATTSRAARITGRLDLARQTEISTLRLRPRFEVRRYDGASEALDSNDVGAELEFERRGERGSFRLAASAAEDSTLTTELADTGIIEGRARRRTASGQADVSRTISERTHVSVGASFVDVRFDDAGGTGLTPYRYPGAFVAFSLAATDRSKLQITANGARLDIPGTDRRIDNYSLRANWRADVTERLNVDLSAGMSRSKTEFAADQGVVFGLTGRWTIPRSTLHFTAAREVEPSGLGRMVEVDSISGSWLWLAGERTTLTIALRHSRREDLLFGLFPERREYSTGYAALGWQLAREWNLELRAGVSRQSYELVDFDASGERIALSVKWSPTKRAMAR